MTGDSEVEIVDTADHCPGTQNHNAPSETGALVEVTFQKNPYREQKYLEAEPKALGLTQIMLSLFFVNIILVKHKNDWACLSSTITGSLSSIGIIAGSVAIAAQTLHLPKLKACLGMQIVTCAASVIYILMSLMIAVDLCFPNHCWDYHYENATSQHELCDKLMEAHSHLQGLAMLCQAAQVAISATLAAFCCKVIQCCSPQTSVPMIVVNAPTAPQ
ncbi:uncharacterized protein LOC118825812 isoform X2 [Colossoma macropomum]|uniref:uncharacterized protein LOC118825812 isoform X2 n=1 Tax=Colossoma macropomum TaxID=42526 RepID=UPI001863D4C1|nr:uncharacterized protein LOC118825812 isoform X2 [Colossoma macropomum]